ncbi:TPA: hypothetical protein DF272_00725 [Candidatus Falkowbacteria bacterium]|nr:hypothetical protein [Candidatus Falkowbacteria bacterium]
MVQALKELQDWLNEVTWIISTFDAARGYGFDWYEKFCRTVKIRPIKEPRERYTEKAGFHYMFFVIESAPETVDQLGAIAAELNSCPVGDRVRQLVRNAYEIVYLNKDAAELVDKEFLAGTIDSRNPIELMKRSRWRHIYRWYHHVNPVAWLMRLALRFVDARNYPIAGGRAAAAMSLIGHGALLLIFGSWWLDDFYLALIGVVGVSPFLYFSARSNVVLGRLIYNSRAVAAKRPTTTEERHLMTNDQWECANLDVDKAMSDDEFARYLNEGWTLVEMFSVNHQRFVYKFKRKVVA